MKLISQSDIISMGYRLVGEIAGFIPEAITTISCIAIGTTKAWTFIINPHS